MKKQLILLAIALGSSIGLLGADMRPIIKIGMIGPISGENANIGQNMRDGILLRLSELSEDTHYRYEVVLEDDGFENKKTNLAIVKLRDIDKVDAVVSCWGQASSVIIPQLKDTGIINIATDRWGDPKPYPYDFIVGPSVTAYTDSMIKALKGMQIKRVALISSTAMGEVAYDKVFKEKLKANNIDLVYYRMVPFGISDFRTMILKIQKANPEVVLNDMYAPQNEQLFKQMKEMGYRPRIGCPSTFFLYFQDKSLVERSFYTLNKAPNPTFMDRFEKRFGRPTNYPAAFTYDALDLFINACENASAATKDKPTPEAIAQELRKTKDYPAALGKIRFTPPVNLDTPLAYFVIENGQSREVSLEELLEFYQEQ